MRLITEYAFTLAEILIVVIIISIAAGLGIPKYDAMIASDRARLARTDMKLYYQAQQLYRARNDGFLKLWKTIGLDKMNEKLGLNMNVPPDIGITFPDPDTGGNALMLSFSYGALNYQFSMAVVADQPWVWGTNPVCTSTPVNVLCQE
ncbi:MAG: prepilin-type N-terminal cleavage/methylation domain-containing protein [Candidatus Omnitrophica bacterium]|nr:prepilin-type N-terminal cleavage/methylation domain-containing protein [Candidatus Omnitrophota bacterium]